MKSPDTSDVWDLNGANLCSTANHLLEALSPHSAHISRMFAPLSLALALALASVRLPAFNLQNRGGKNQIVAVS